MGFSRSGFSGIPLRLVIFYLAPTFLGRNLAPWFSVLFNWSGVALRFRF